MLKYNDIAPGSESLHCGNYSSLGAQAIRLAERRARAHLEARVNGVSFDVFRNVYDTGRDTELMADVVAIGSKERFVEVGCGCGAISILLARRAKFGLGLDCSPMAVQNSLHNKRVHGQDNVKFQVANALDGVEGRFDVIVCNPPYNRHPAKDLTERMFWDPDDSMKFAFFEQAPTKLAPHGRVYFGWADFSDLDANLPLRLGKVAGLHLEQVFQRPSRSGTYQFIVLEFVRG